MPEAPMPEPTPPGLQEHWGKKSSDKPPEVPSRSPHSCANLGEGLSPARASRGTPGVAPGWEVVSPWLPHCQPQ